MTRNNARSLSNSWASCCFWSTLSVIMAATVCKVGIELSAKTCNCSGIAIQCAGWQHPHPRVGEGLVAFWQLTINNYDNDDNETSWTNDRWTLCTCAGMAFNIPIPSHSHLFNSNSLPPDSQVFDLFSFPCGLFPFPPIPILLMLKLYIISDTVIICS